LSTATSNVQRAREDLRLAHVAAKQLKEGRPKTQSAAEWAACEEALKNGARQNVVKKNAALNITEVTFATSTTKATKAKVHTEALRKQAVTKERVMKVKQTAKVVALQESRKMADAIAAKLNADLKVAEAKLATAKATAADAADKTAQLSTDITQGAAQKAEENVKLAQAQVNAAKAGIDKSLVGEEDLAKTEESSINAKMSEATQLKEVADGAVVKAKSAAEKAVKKQQVAVDAAKKLNIPRGSNSTYNATNAVAEQETALGNVKSTNKAVENTKEKVVLAEASLRDAVGTLTKAVEANDKAQKSLDDESKQKEVTKESQAKSEPRAAAAAAAAIAEKLKESNKKAADDLEKLKASSNSTFEEVGEGKVEGGKNLAVAAAESNVEFGKVKVAQSELDAEETKGVTLFNKRTSATSASSQAKVEEVSAQEILDKLKKTKAEPAQLETPTKMLQDAKLAIKSTSIAEMKAVADFTVNKKTLDAKRESVKKITDNEKRQKNALITNLSVAKEKAQGPATKAKIKVEAVTTSLTTAGKAQTAAQADRSKKEVAYQAAGAAAQKDLDNLNSITAKVNQLTGDKTEAESTAKGKSSKENNLAVVNAEEKLRLEVEKKQAATVANDRAQQALTSSKAALDAAMSTFEGARHHEILTAQAKLKAEASRRNADAKVRDVKTQLVAAESNAARVAAMEKMESANKAAQKTFDNVAEEKASKAAIQESKAKEKTVKTETQSKVAQVEEAALATQRKADEESAFAAKAAKKNLKRKSKAENEMIKEAKRRAMDSGSKKSEKEINDMVQKEIATKGKLQEAALDSETKSRSAAEVSAKETKSKTDLKAAQKKIIAGIQASIDANKEKLEKTKAVLAEALKGKAEAEGKVAAIMNKEKAAKGSQTDALKTQKEASEKDIVKLKGAMGEQGKKAAAEAQQKAGETVREKSNKEGVSSTVADNRVAAKMKEMRAKEETQQKLNEIKLIAVTKAVAAARADILKIQSDIVKRQADLKEGKQKLGMRISEQEQTGKEVAAKESHKQMIKQHELKSKLQSSLGANEATRKQNLKESEARLELSSKKVIEKATKLKGGQKETIVKKMKEFKAKTDVATAEAKAKLAKTQKTQAKIQAQAKMMGAEKEKAFKGMNLSEKAQKEYLATVEVASKKAETIKAETDAKYQKVIAPFAEKAQKTVDKERQLELDAQGIYYINVTARTAAYADSGTYYYGTDYPQLLAQMKVWKADKKKAEEQKVNFVPPSKYAIWLHELQTATKKEAVVKREKRVEDFTKQQKKHLLNRPNITTPNSPQRMRQFENAVTGNTRLRIHTGSTSLDGTARNRGSEQNTLYLQSGVTWAMSGIPDQACMSAVYNFKDNANPSNTTITAGFPIMMACDDPGYKNTNLGKSSVGRRRSTVSVGTTDAHQFWAYDASAGTIQDKGTNTSNYCLHANTPHVAGSQVKMVKCSPGSAKQKWLLTSTKSYPGFFARGSKLKSQATNGLCVAPASRECGHIGAGGSGSKIGDSATKQGISGFKITANAYTNAGMKMDSCGCEAACNEDDNCKSWTAYQIGYYYAYQGSRRRSYKSVGTGGNPSYSRDVKCELYTGASLRGYKYSATFKFGSKPYKYSSYLEVGEGASAQQGAAVESQSGYTQGHGRTGSGYYLPCYYCNLNYRRGGQKSDPVKQITPSEGSRLVMVPCTQADLKWDAIDINGPGGSAGVEELKTQELLQSSERSGATQQRRRRATPAPTAKPTPKPTPRGTPAPTAVANPKCTSADTATATGAFASSAATTSRGRCRDWATNQVWGALSSGGKLTAKCKKNAFKNSCKRTCCEAKLADTRARDYQFIGNKFKPKYLVRKVAEDDKDRKCFDYDYKVTYTWEQKSAYWRYYNRRYKANHKYYMRQIMVTRNSTLITHQRNYDYNITWEKTQIDNRLAHATSQFNYYNTKQLQALKYPSNQPYGKIPEWSSMKGVLKVMKYSGYRTEFFMLKFPDTVLKSDDSVAGARLILNKISGHGSTALNVQVVRCAWGRNSVTYTSFMDTGVTTCSAPLSTESFPSTNGMFSTTLNPTPLNRGRMSDSAFCFKVSGGSSSEALISSEKALNQTLAPTLELMMLKSQRPTSNATNPPTEDKETEKETKEVYKVRVTKRKQIYKAVSMRMLKKKQRDIPNAKFLSRAERNERDDRSTRRERLEMAIFMHERAVKRNSLLAKKKNAALLVNNETETDAAKKGEVDGAAAAPAAAKVKVDKKWANFTDPGGAWNAKELEIAALKVFKTGNYLPLRAVLKKLPNHSRIPFKAGAKVSVPAVGSPGRNEELGELEGQRVALEKPSEDNVASLSADDVDVAAKQSTDVTTKDTEFSELIQLEDVTASDGPLA